MNEIFEYFFDAYFHQDWRGDYETSLSAVKGFAKAEPADSVGQLVQALNDLRSTDDLPQNTFNKLGGNFKPESEGLSVSEWISRALELLDS